MAGRWFESCQKNIKISKFFLESLGFIINKSKSHLIPSILCKFLGFLFDSHQKTIVLTDEKRSNIYDLILNFRNLSHCTIREFPQLVGNITAACPTVNYGWVHSKAFEQQRYLAFNHSNNDYDQNMPVSSDLIK